MYPRMLEPLELETPSSNGKYQVACTMVSDNTTSVTFKGAVGIVIGTELATEVSDAIDVG